MQVMSNQLACLMYTNLLPGIMVIKDLVPCIKSDDKKPRRSSQYSLSFVSQNLRMHRLKSPQGLVLSPNLW
jgi:hypothetical protein